MASPSTSARPGSEAEQRARVVSLAIHWPSRRARLERDEERIEQAVADLNRIYVSKALETARLIGVYVLERFFDGSLERFRERGRKEVSLRRLAARPDLRFSASFLSISVAIVAQLEELPPEIGSELPLSHHRLLLAVRDPGQKVALATKAVAGRLTVKALAAEVRGLRRPPAGSGRRPLGRPPLPMLVKCLREVRGVAARAVALGTAPELPWPASEPNGLRELVRELDTQLDALRTLLEVVRERLGSCR